jgi:hypothetical protein
MYIILGILGMAALCLDKFIHLLLVIESILTRQSYET